MFSMQNGLHIILLCYVMYGSETLISQSPPSNPIWDNDNPEAPAAAATATPPTAATSEGQFTTLTALWHYGIYS